MRLKVLIGVLVLLIVINLATIGTFLFVHLTRKAPEPQEFRGPGMMSKISGHHTAPWRGRLHTKEREVLIGLLHDFRRETSELRDRVHDLEEKTFRLMQLDPVPIARVDSLLEDIADTRLEISKIAAAKLIESKTVLPPEDQEMFFNAILDARPGRPGMPGRHRGTRKFKRQGDRVKPDSLE